MSLWPEAILPDLDVKEEPKDAETSNGDGQMIKLEPGLEPVPADLHNERSFYGDSPEVNEPYAPSESKPVVKEEVGGALQQLDDDEEWNVTESSELSSSTPAASTSSYIRLILKSGKFRCTLCGKEAETRYYLQSHVRAAHFDLLSERKRCTKCGRWFGQALVHSHNCTQQSKSCQCQICGKTFRFAYKVRVHHRVVHLKGFVGGTSVECKICGRVLTTKYSYQNHVLAVHSQNSDDKKGLNASFKYLCKVAGCKRKYRSREGRNYHMEKVHGEKKKEPDVPNPGISEQNQRRKFKCMAAFCNKEFPSSFSLSLHQKSAHRKLGLGMGQSSTSASYECDNCRFQFRSLPNLEEHRKECG